VQEGLFRGGEDQQNKATDGIPEEHSLRIPAAD